MTYGTVSQCRSICDADATCLGFEYRNANGCSCYLRKVAVAIDSTGFIDVNAGGVSCTTQTSNVAEGFIVGAGGSACGTDCPLTYEYWHKAGGSWSAACTTPSPTGYPTFAACSGADGAITNGAASPCTSSLASGSTCTPTCNSGSYRSSYTLSGNRQCVAGVLTDTAVCGPSSCSVLEPTGGQLGTCSSTIVSGGTCQPMCNSGFSIVGTTSSCLLGTLTAASCIGLTSSSPPNTPGSGRSSLTISGAGFGLTGFNGYIGFSDGTPSVRLEATSYCFTSSWTSNTGLKCLPEALLSQQTQLVAATVAATVGTAVSRLFSYDGRHSGLAVLRCPSSFS